MAGSNIKMVEDAKCGQCGKILRDKDNKRNGHSQKELMRCLFTANHNLYNTILRVQALEKEVAELKGEAPKIESTPQEDAEVILDAEKEGNWKDEKKAYQLVATEDNYVKKDE